MAELTHLEEHALLLMTKTSVYGLQLHDAFRVCGVRELALSVLYTLLVRLEKKGFASSQWGEPGQVKGKGPRRHYYQITGRGLLALSEAEKRRERCRKWPKGCCHDRNGAAE